MAWFVYYLRGCMSLYCFLVLSVYSVVYLLLQTCVECRGSNLALVIFLHILFGLLLVGAAIVLNVAAIPAVDTLLFLCQVSCRCVSVLKLILESSLDKLHMIDC